MKEPKKWQARCPDCGKAVDRVDGEYARHEGRNERLCLMSRREIVAVKRA